MANSPADGYTLMLVVLSNALSATLYTNLRYDLKRDLVGVAGIANAPYVMMVNPDLPPKTVPEFIAYAKANPGRINMASGGSGTSTHVLGELFKMMAHVDLVHIPYRGNYIPDLLAGQTQLLFGPVPQSSAICAPASCARSASPPPSASTCCPTCRRSASCRATRGRLVRARRAQGHAAGDRRPPQPGDQRRARQRRVQGEARQSRRRADVATPAEYTRFIADEVDKWAKVIRYAAIKPD